MRTAYTVDLTEESDSKERTLEKPYFAYTPQSGVYQLVHGSRTDLVRPGGIGSGVGATPDTDDILKPDLFAERTSLETPRIYEAECSLTYW